jgi:hypothetical protein
VLLVEASRFAPTEPEPDADETTIITTKHHGASEWRICTCIELLENLKNTLDTRGIREAALKASLDKHHAVFAQLLPSIPSMKSAPPASTCSTNGNTDVDAMEIDKSQTGSNGIDSDQAQHAAADATPQVRLTKAIALPAFGIYRTGDVYTPASDSSNSNSSSSSTPTAKRKPARGRPPKNPPRAASHDASGVGDAMLAQQLASALLAMEQRLPTHAINKRFAKKRDAWRREVESDSELTCDKIAGKLVALHGALLTNSISPWFHANAAEWLEINQSNAKSAPHTLRLLCTILDKSIRVCNALLRQHISTRRFNSPAFSLLCRE